MITFEEFIYRMSLYDTLYLYGVLCVILLFAFYLMGKKRGEPINHTKTISYFVLLLFIIYFGTYPFQYGADRYRYVQALIYSSYETSDRIWNAYTRFFGKFLTPYPWLILTAAIYVLGFYVYSKKLHNNKAIIMMMGFIGFLFFKAYAVNTMRAGFAAAILFYALTFREKNKFVFWILLFAVVNMHFTMILPVLSLLIAQYFPRTKLFFVFWLICIPLSAMAGNYFQVLFEPYFADYTDTAAGYLLDEDERYKSGFRIDFIIYSVLPVLFAYYYIFKKNIKDDFYLNIFNAYLIANSFWLLVIRANFSDRMAYLSWMFIPVLLLYPLLKYEIWKRQNRKIAYVLIAQELFTFVLSIRG